MKHARSLPLGAQIESFSFKYYSSLKIRLIKLKRCLIDNANYFSPVSTSYEI